MAHCAPILTYGIEVIKISNKSRQLMKVAYNAIFRRVLRYRRNEGVADVQNYFGYSDWETLCAERQKKFFKRLQVRENSLIRSLLSTYY